MNALCANEPVHAFVASLFELAGAPLSEETPTGTYAWDGQTFRLGGVEVGSRLHDLAHWLIATEEERTLPEFGLGTSPWSGSLEADDLAPWSGDRESIHLEHRASLLGIHFMKHIGLDWKYTFEQHSWPYIWSSEIKDVRKDTLRWLRIHEFVSKGGRPTLLGKVPREVRESAKRVGH